MKIIRSFSAGLLILLLSCNGMDKDAAYADRAQVEADGAFTKGWAPDFLPDSATNIRESHNLDTNECWLTFTFEKDAEHSMKTVLASTDLQNVKFPRASSSRRRPWWPQNLLAPSPNLERQFTFYTYVNGCGNRWFVAVECEAPKVWCWHVP